MLCLEFEITQVDVDNVQIGFQSWVVDYEWWVFFFLLVLI